MPNQEPGQTPQRPNLAQEARRRIATILNYPKTTHDSAFIQPAPAYQRIFTSSGEKKAEDVLAYVKQHIEEEAARRTIYMSLGGGDGSEIGWAMKHGVFAKGLLVEWMDQAVDAAKVKLPSFLKQGQEMRYLTGDVAQKFDQCVQQLQDWRKEGMTGLIISAQAVLHELLWRADSKRFSWEKLVSLFDGFQVKLFFAREPCLPPTDGGWRDPVRICIPHVKGADLWSAMELLQRHFMSQLKGELRELFDGAISNPRNDECVAPGPLVVEFLHKFMRHSSPEHLRHEMQECLTAFDPEPLARQLAPVFGGASRVQVDPFCSDGFRKDYERFRIKANSAGRPDEQLRVPHAFCWIKAFDRHQAAKKRVSGDGVAGGSTTTCERNDEAHHTNLAPVVSSGTPTVSTPLLPAIAQAAESAAPSYSTHNACALGTAPGVAAPTEKDELPTGNWPTSVHYPQAGAEQCYFLFVHYGLQSKTDWEIAGNRGALRINYGSVMPKLVRDLRYLQRILSPARDSSQRWWKGFAFLFLDPGWTELLRQEQGDKLDLVTLGKNLTTIAFDLKNNLSKIMPEWEQWFRIVTASDLIDLVACLKDVDGAQHSADYAKWLTGGGDALRYDGAKVVEAAVRIANIGRSVPVLRFDDDVIFYGCRAFSPLLSQGDPSTDLRDHASLVANLKSRREWRSFTDLAKNILTDLNSTPALTKATLLDALNSFIQTTSPSPTAAGTEDDGVVLRNRLDLESAFPANIARLDRSKVVVPDPQKEADSARRNILSICSRYRQLSEDPKVNYFVMSGGYISPDEAGKVLGNPATQYPNIDVFVNGFATRVVQLASLPKSGSVREEETVVLNPELVASFLRKLVHFGANPFLQVISGAGLCLSDSAILDLPPFSNMRLNVMWIDDHLKYALHHELGHFGIDKRTRHTARLPDVWFHQLRHTKPPNYKNVEWHLKNYMIRLVLGCIADGWLRRTRELKETLRNLTEDEFSAVLKAVPGVYAEEFNRTLPGGWGADANAEASKMQFKATLWNNALSRLRELVQAWGSRDYAETYLGLFTQGTSHLRAGEFQTLFPAAFPEGLQKAVADLERSYKEYPESRARELRTKSPSDPAVSNPTLSDAVCILVEDFTEYFDWVLFWKHFVQSVRFLLNRSDSRAALPWMFPPGF